MRKLIAPLAVALVVATAAPAHAAYATQNDHIEVKHYAPDSGYSRDLLLRCGNQGFLIREGKSSRDFRHVPFHPDCEGVTSIYVRAGEEWWSRADGVGQWRKRFDATGWHRLPKAWRDGAGVTVRRD